jgi:hypothetical protein
MGDFDGPGGSETTGTATAQDDGPVSKRQKLGHDGEPQEDNQHERRDERKRGIASIKPE